MRLRAAALSAVIFVGCGILDPKPVCGCQPAGGGSTVFAGVVLGAGDAPVQDALMNRLLLNDAPCTRAIPGFRVVDTSRTGVDGRFRQRTDWAGGDKCWLMWADPPAGSALAGSDSQIVHVDFRGATAVPDSSELVFRLRVP